ncbi:MAG: conjugative transposon protein TraK [Bacteroidetes bacterium]|nr:conjugative transposon protein TraK [Bacteroidota bacterium]
MFSQLKNIDTAFKHIKLFSLVLILSCATICCYSIYKSFEMVTQVQERIYILANGKALEAWSAERRDNIPVEARDHVKMFHYYFFTLDPDDRVIEANVTKALYLADASAKRQYDNLKESRYYSNIISGNISQEVVTDSIKIEVNDYPFYFRCYARQKLIRKTSIVTRSLVTEGYLRNVSRSDNNPHGFLIEKWHTLENKDIKTENRL